MERKRWPVSRQAECGGRLLPKKSAAHHPSWPPPPPPERERRVLNLVELIADPNDEEGGGFDQPCAFGNRVGYHAVYCHNDAWPDSPSKCRRGKGCAEVYGIPEQDNRHEDCPGFVANPDFVATE